MGHQVHLRVICLVLCAKGATPDIVSDVRIDAGPLHWGSGEELHRLNSLVALMKVFQCMVKQLRRDADVITFG